MAALHNQAEPRVAARDEEVLDAAIRVFWSKGYAAASVKEVAAEVGLLKGSLYHYTDSKEDLLMRILDTGHARWVEITEHVSAMDAPPLERLYEHLRLHVLWYLRDIEHVGVFLREWRWVGEERRAVVLERRRGYDRFLRALITECWAAERVEPRFDVRYASLYVLGALNAAPDWYRRGRGPDGPAPIADAFASMTVAVITGLPSPH